MDLVNQKIFTLTSYIEIIVFLFGTQGDKSSISFSPCKVPQERKSSQCFMVKQKKILHFSDGIMEQCSSDEEGVHRVSQTATLVDPVSFLISTLVIFSSRIYIYSYCYQRTLSWMPWIHHNASKALALFDYAGESIADFLGITSPKYSYEIAEAQRMKEDEAKEMKERDIEMSGWIEPGKTSQMELQDENTNRTSPKSSTPVIVHPPAEQAQSV